MHLRGLGVPVDHERARELLQRAVDADYAPAQCVLGQMYSEGLGVDADENEAERLLLQSAENGHPNAQLSMAAFATQRRCSK
jgi:TPR repeat protein